MRAPLTGVLYNARTKIFIQFGGAQPLCQTPLGVQQSAGQVCEQPTQGIFNNAEKDLAKQQKRHAGSAESTYELRKYAAQVLYNARTIKWCFLMRAPLNGVFYNARTIKWCFI